MKKKIFISAIISIFAFLVLINTSFAANNAKDTLKDSGEKSKNTIQSAGNTIQNATMDATNVVENVFDNGKNTVQNMTDDMGNGVNTLENDVTGGYNTDQTSAEQTTNAASDIWLWVILAVIALMVIGVVWFYTSQTNDSNTRR